MTKMDFTHYTIGPYRLEACRQQRPLTSLYLAHDTQQDKPVFIEVMNQPAAADEAAASRFQRRLETVRQIEHPFVAPILESGQTRPTPPASHADDSPQPVVYAVIEHVAGPTLATQLDEWHENDSWPDIPTRLGLIQELAAAFTAVHPVGIFHHDLRPAHLIMGENGRLILIDLGVPPVPEPPVPPPDPHQPPAQLDYASPEQQAGKPLSAASNIYSLGVILYELLATHRPYLPRSEWDIFERTELPREIPLSEVRPDLTTATHIVVKTCLWPQEWNRYETAVNLVNALEAARQSEQQQLEKLANPGGILHSVKSFFKRDRG